MNSIIAIDENGDEITFFILDTITHNSTTYVLASESDVSDGEDDDFSDATILKEKTADNDYITYTFIDNDDEFFEVMSLFNENNNDYDLM